MTLVGCGGNLGVTGLPPAGPGTEAETAIVLTVLVKVVVYAVINAGFTPSKMDRIAISSTAQKPAYECDVFGTRNRFFSTAYHSAFVEARRHALLGAPISCHWGSQGIR